MRPVTASLMPAPVVVPTPRRMTTPGMMRAPSWAAGTWTAVLAIMGTTVLLLVIVVSIIVVTGVVVIPVVAVPFALLFSFAFGLSFFVVIIVRVVVIIVVVHRERDGHERIKVVALFDHFLASKSAGIDSFELRGFIRRWTRRGRARRAKLAKLSAAQGTVAIAIQLAEGRRCAVDLRGAEGTVLIGIEQSQQSARRTGTPRKSGPARRPIATGSATFRSTITRSATFGTATLRTAAETPRHGCAGRVEFFAGERIVVVGIEAFQQPAKHLAARLGNLIQGNTTILIAVQFTQAIERGALWAWAAVWTLAPFGSPWPVIRLSATSLAPLFGLIV